MPQHKTLRRIVFGLGLLAAAAFALIAAAALSLHFWILPRIDSFRPQIERYLAQASGLQVRIHSIVLKRNTWEPEIELRQVQFADATGQAVLSMPSVEAAVSIRSLARLGFTHIAILSPNVQAQRSADGRIRIAGIALNDPKLSTTTVGSNPTDAVMHWLLEQPQLEIRNASLQWTDAQRNVPALTFNHIEVKLRNDGREHLLQTALTPPADWGQPLSATAQWTHDILGNSANWRTWAGHAEANIPDLDIAQLRRYCDGLSDDVVLGQGRGSLHIQAQFEHARSASLNVNAQLNTVQVTLGKNLPELALHKFHSQFDVDYNSQSNRDSLSIATSRLGFSTQNGQQWPGGNVRITMHKGTANSGGEVQGNDWDIGMITDVAKHLPLGQSVHKALASYQPQGKLEQFTGQWSGDINAPSSFAARGKAHGLGWLAQQGVLDAATGQRALGKPGIEAATVRFDIDQSKGHVDLQMNKGSAEFPGVFEEPRLLFDTLQAKVQWAIEGNKIRVELPKITFSNADATGSARAVWHTRDDAKTLPERFPGVLDLSGVIEKARAERVVRYLPLVIGKQALQYVASSIRSGSANNARIKIAGDLRHIALGKDAQGKKVNSSFRFEVPLNNAEFAFVPRYLQAADEKPWPTLTQLNGLLLIDHVQLSVLNATARFSTGPDLQVSQLNAHIPDLGKNLTVNVNAKVSGPLQQALNLTRLSPIAVMAENALDQTVTTGPADIDLQLHLPVNHMHTAKVRGAVHFNGNDIRITPAAPLLARSQGTVTFDENGFALKNTRAHLLGEVATLEGGTQTAHSSAQKITDTDNKVRINIQGRFSAEGLRKEKAFESLSTWGNFLQGSSAYKAVLQFNGGAPELTFDTNLAGLAVLLPAPLNKAAASTLPLHISNTVTAYKKDALGVRHALQDTLFVQLGQRATAHYQRRLHPPSEPQVLRGLLSIGERAINKGLALPKQSVQALILLDSLDIQAWNKVFDSKVQSAQQGHGAQSVATSTDSASGLSPYGYMPDQLAIETPILIAAGHRLDAVSGQIMRQGPLWKLALESRQIKGSLEYLPPVGTSASSIKARLKQLTLAPEEFERSGPYIADASRMLPTLDIDATNVDLAGYKLDRVVLRAGTSSSPTKGWAAESSGTTWPIHALSVWAPNSELQASGVWKQPVPTPADSQTTNTPTTNAAQEALSLDVHFATNNLGALLAHFGKPDLLSNGSGNMTGKLLWQGSPVSINAQTLAGTIKVDLRNGHLSAVDTGAGKFIGLLGLQMLPQLVNLGTKGLGFSQMDGEANINQGIAYINHLHVDGPIADIKLAGEVTLATQTLDLEALVQPKIDLTGAALIATAVNPAIGLGGYFAQALLSKPLSNISTQVLSIQGDVDNMQTTPLRGDAAQATTQRILAKQPPRRRVADAFLPSWLITPDLSTDDQPLP